MTLRRYEPRQLDELALRMLDSCSSLHRLAERCRENQIEDFRLNDKKAMEWLSNLELWIRRAEDELELREIKNRGVRLAKELRTTGDK